MTLEKDLDLEIKQHLEALKEAPRRSLEAAAQTRAAYLSRVQTAGQNPLVRQRVAKQESLSLWMKLASAAMALLLLLTGGGITAYAAQDSLPNESLYPVKIFIEDASLSLAGDSEAKSNLALEYINRRGDEIVGLKSQGEPLDEAVNTRLAEKMDYSLQLASEMEDTEMQAELARIQTSLQTQESKMQGVENESGSDPILTQTRAIIQTRLTQAEAGLEDPVLLRQEIKNGKLQNQPEDFPGQKGPPDGEGGSGPGGPPENAPSQSGDDNSPSGPGNGGQGKGK